MGVFVKLQVILVNIYLAFMQKFKFLHCSWYISSWTVYQIQYSTLNKWDKLNRNNCLGIFYSFIECLFVCFCSISEMWIAYFSYWWVITCINLWIFFIKSQNKQRRICTFFCLGKRIITHLQYRQKINVLDHVQLVWFLFVKRTRLKKTIPSRILFVHYILLLLVWHCIRDIDFFYWRVLHLNYSESQSLGQMIRWYYIIKENSFSPHKLIRNWN